MKNINEYINALLNYAVEKGLMKEEDAIYGANRIIELLEVGSFERDEKVKKDLNEILSTIFDYKDTKKIEYIDILEAKIIDAVMPRPSEVIEKFNSLYKINKKEATTYLYNLSLNSNYIKSDKLKQNMKWDIDTEYGKMKVAINMARPEGDAKIKAIAQKTVNKDEYPKCALCYQNVGHTGNKIKAARNNLRVVPIELADEKWYMQFSPYQYYPEHCIAIKKEHEKMEISKKTFDRLTEFVEKFPHYFMGTNADLPLVGASIIEHDHFQGGGNVEFPIFKAKTRVEYEVTNYEDLKVEYLEWPVEVIKISSADRYRVIELSEKIYTKWCKFSDEKANIIAESNKERHNTVNALCRKKDEEYEMYITLRNNAADKENPNGIFCQKANLQYIKKESLGIIEIMGLAVLPPRIRESILDLEDKLIHPKKQIVLDKHFEKLEKEINEKHPNVYDTTAMKIINEEIGIKFVNILEECSVFKFVDKQKEMNKFILTVK